MLMKPSAREVIQGLSLMHLTELCRVIRVLMDEKTDTDDQDMIVALASLEYAARKQKRAIEERLAVRN